MPVHTKHKEEEEAGKTAWEKTLMKTKGMRHTGQQHWGASEAGAEDGGEQRLRPLHPVKP